MPVGIREWKDDSFQFFLDLYKHTAKLAAERMKMMNAASPDSIDYKVQHNYLQNELAPSLGKLGTIACNFIKSYNENPDAFQLYTRKQALDAELAVEEVTGILREAGITVNFICEPEKLNSSNRTMFYAF